jgi:hypothetical protein
MKTPKAPLTKLIGTMGVIAIPLISGALRSAEIPAGYVPVAIHRYTDDPKSAHMVGMGTMFNRGRHVAVLTAGHIFNKDETGKDEAYYLIQKLDPLGDPANLQLSIVSIEEEGNIPGWKDRSDAVICDVGKPGTPVRAYYVASLREDPTPKSFRFYPAKSAQYMTSIATRKKVTIVGFAMGPNKQYAYQLAILNSSPSDRGTGFVDENGWIYILKEPLDPALFPNDLASRLGYPIGSPLVVLMGAMSYD